MRDYLAAVDGAGAPVLRRDSLFDPLPVSSQDAALAIMSLMAMGETARAGTLAADVLAGLEGVRIPAYPYVQVGEQSVQFTQFGQFGGHIAMLLALSCTPQGIPADLLTDALTLAPDGLVVWDTVVRWGTFELGDGTRLGEKTGDRSALLRETAMLGLAFYNEGMRSGNAAMIGAAYRAAATLESTYRSDFSPTVYATAVSVGRASLQPDAAAYAYAGLLAHRLNLHDLTDAMLGQINRCATARLTPHGVYAGFGSPRATLMVAALMHAAGEYGRARDTLRGTVAARVPTGPHTGILMDTQEDYDLSATQAAEVFRRPAFMAHAGA